MGTNCNPVSLFCMWLSNFPRTIYWRGFFFLHCMFWLLCQKLFAYIHVVLFLGSQFCSIGLCVCFLFCFIIIFASTMLFWLLVLWSIIWSQVVWYLRLHSFFCDSFDYSGSFMVPPKSGNFCSISLKNDFGILISIALNPYIALGDMDILSMLILPIHEHRNLSISFCLFQSLLIMLCSFQSMGGIPPFFFLVSSFCKLCLSWCVWLPLGLWNR